MSVCKDAFPVFKQLDMSKALGFGVVPLVSRQESAIHTNSQSVVDAVIDGWKAALVVTVLCDFLGKQPTVPVGRRYGHDRVEMGVEQIERFGQ